MQESIEIFIYPVLADGLEGYRPSLVRGKNDAWIAVLVTKLGDKRALKWKKGLEEKVTLENARAYMRNQKLSAPPHYYFIFDPNNKKNTYFEEVWKYWIKSDDEEKNRLVIFFGYEGIKWFENLPDEKIQMEVAHLLAFGFPYIKNAVKEEETTAPNSYLDQFKAILYHRPTIATPKCEDKDEDERQEEDGDNQLHDGSTTLEEGNGTQTEKKSGGWIRRTLTSQRAEGWKVEYALGILLGIAMAFFGMNILGKHIPPNLIHTKPSHPMQLEEKECKQNTPNCDECEKQCQTVRAQGGLETNEKSRQELGIYEQTLWTVLQTSLKFIADKREMETNAEGKKTTTLWPEDLGSIQSFLQDEYRGKKYHPRARLLLASANMFCDFDWDCETDYSTMKNNECIEPISQADMRLEKVGKLKPNVMSPSALGKLTRLLKIYKKVTNLQPYSATKLGFVTLISAPPTISDEEWKKVCKDARAVSQ